MTYYFYPLVEKLDFGYFGNSVTGKFGFKS